MKEVAPEFSRFVRLDQLGQAGTPVRIEADVQEREALARRFRLPAINLLAAEYSLDKENGILMARGRIEADIVQSCVATGTPVPERIAEPFIIRFEREGTDQVSDAEIELSAEDCDVIFFSGDRIDMGEAIAETLSLSVNPYPRAPGADQLLRDAGVISEEEAGPFAKLRELTKKS